MNDEVLAGHLYEIYCTAVGGKAFNGVPLPAWDQFRADPAKQKQSDAWLTVAGAARGLLQEKNKTLTVRDARGYLCNLRVIDQWKHTPDGFEVTLK